MRTCLFARVTAALAASAVASGAAAQPASGSEQEVSLDVDSGWIRPAAGGGPQVLFEEAVTVPGASWLRLRFGQVALPEGGGAEGEGAFLRITSWQDGARQTLDRTQLAQWRGTSAYFNGDSVLVELLATPGTGPARVQIVKAIAGEPVQNAARSICGNSDDRQLSSDARVARLMPAGCSAFLVNDARGCFLTSGACASSLEVIQFNVPLSDAGGAIQHPLPEDQYAVDFGSRQALTGSTIGNNWTYFGAFPNSETSMTPFQAQQGSFEMQLASLPTAGQTVQVVGFGTSQAQPTWNLVQKSHTGPLVQALGTTLTYAVDTTGGDGGGPIVSTATGEAVGIHTHGGCFTGAGNQGTSITHPGLAQALGDPCGVCAEPFDRSRYELARLVQPDPAAGDEFGASVAVWGDTAVVGAPLKPYADGAPLSVGAGAAYVFERSGADWVGSRLASPPSFSPGNRYEFGFDVAIHGGWIVVSAPAPNGPAGAPSEVHVYERSSSGWSLVQSLSPSVSANDLYGHAVAVDDDWLMVGAPQNDTSQGAVYVHQRLNGAWVYSETLAPPPGEARQFGYDVALDGGWLIVGAPVEEVGSVRTGAAYLYELSGGTWVWRSTVAPSGGEDGDRYGAAVALRGDLIAVGSPFSDDDGTSAGSVHLYERTDAWTFADDLIASDAEIGDGTGFAVAIADDVVLCGSPGNDFFGDNSGALYRFERDGTGAWDHESPPTVALDSLTDDRLATSIAATERFVAVGAPLKDGGGAAYVFALRPCPADRNGDAIVDVFDLLDYLDAWFSGSADQNQDLVTDIFDLLAYLDVWFTRCE